MSWPPRHRDGVRADIMAGVKTVQAIAQDHKCSDRFVYAVMIEEGLSRQYITQEEWKYIKDWRANRLRNRASLVSGAQALVGSAIEPSEKARRACSAAPLAETIA